MHVMIQGLWALIRFLPPMSVVCMMAVLAEAMPATAKTGDDVFDAANSHFERRNYGEAIRAYESILQKGHSSPELHFNLGNAYFRDQQLGRALTHYLRAERLAPRDPDIQANLRFTRDTVSGNSSIQPSPFERLFTYFSLNEVAVVAAILLWMFGVLFCLSQLKPGLKPLVRRYTTTAAILWGIALVWLIASDYFQNRRLVIASSREAIIRFGPLEESRTAFTVSDGTELRLLDERGQWLQVRDRRGQVGWVQQEQVALFP